MLVLDSHETAAPFLSELNVVIVLFGEVLPEGLEVLHVLLLDLGEREAGDSLHVDDLAESFLALNEAEWNTLLAAERGEEHNEFNGIDIVRHDDKLGLAFLDQGGNVVDTELDEVGLGSLLGVLGSLAFGLLL